MRSSIASAEFFRKDSFSYFSRPGQRLPELEKICWSALPYHKVTSFSHRERGTEFCHKKAAEFPEELLHFHGKAPKTLRLGVLLSRAIEKRVPHLKGWDTLF